MQLECHSNERKIHLPVSSINLLRMLYYLRDFSDEFLRYFVWVRRPRPVHFRRIHESQPNQELNIIEQRH